MPSYLDHFTLPSGSTYELHDPRVDDLHGLDFYVCSSAADTPEGVTWTNPSGTTYTGTLRASEAEPYIYLVYSPNDDGKDSYDEYVSVMISSTKQWEKLGSTDVKITGLKGSYTPAGTVSQPTFSGTAATIKVPTISGGTVSKPTFTGTAATITVKGTPAGTVSKPTFTGTAATLTQSIPYTPGGTVTGGAFSGSATTFQGAYTPAGSVTGGAFTGSATTFQGAYTPGGGVS